MTFSKSLMLSAFVALLGSSATMAQTAPTTNPDISHKKGASGLRISESRCAAATLR